MKYILFILLIMPMWHNVFAQDEPIKIDIYYSKSNELTIEISNSTHRTISILSARESSYIDFEILRNHDQERDTVRYIVEGKDSMRAWTVLARNETYVLKYKVNPKDLYTKANFVFKCEIGIGSSDSISVKQIVGSTPIAPYSGKVKKRNTKGTHYVTFKNRLKGDAVYTNVDQKPEFPGGESALRKFLSNEADKKDPIRQVMGLAVVRVIVEKDGSISHPNIVLGNNSLFWKKALEIVEILPKFKPGYRNGKPVRTFYDVGVVFNLK